ncbi:D-2-hydroxyacid dehydrogenase [Treponema sp.]|uniref:D-2-hydroxyacid dehydrogenase n=1 Tax=Treponema sp. TaxID=166 RepID=UPI0025DD4155|nr:D-2-hydroxyacid dehydrogenase [Treponema sp.]MCR5218689.1 D-2-hydroxyacid dehydrogenase [Treponema sp.]
MKVLVINSFLEQSHFDLIKKTADSLKLNCHFYKTEKDVAPKDYDAEIIYGFAPSIVKTSKNLKWICLPWAGVDSVLKPGYFANEDCLITNSAGSYGVSIAEHMIAMSLVMLRRLNEFFDESRECKWLSPREQKSLKDCRVTLLGTGDIGTSFAKRLRAFEPASITGVCRSGKNDSGYFDSVLPVSRLDEVLPQTDLLAMSLPATKETEGILSKERLALMPDSSYVINVGRGSAIDEDALVSALESGHLAAAALDVFKKEPLPKDSPLWKVKNLLITPHVAGNMTLAYTKDKNTQMFLEDLNNFVHGKSLRYLVDKKLGY